MEKKEVPEEKGLTRRSLLSGAGKIAVVGAGIAAVSGGLNLFSKAEAAGPQALPWPYKKLDIEEVGAITYEKWYEGYCCNAVASGIILPLREKIGEPYTSFPVESLVWGHGGVVGWGTICGTMLGTGVTTGLICGPGVTKTGEQITNEVIQWYTKTELPIYKPKNPKAEVNVKSKSGSPLCHISVGKWMKKADRGFWTAERMDRCARLSADVAMRTAKFLNDWTDGKFKSDLKLPAVAYAHPAQHNCTDCHGSKVPPINKKGNK